MPLHVGTKRLAAASVVLAAAVLLATEAGGVAAARTPVRSTTTTTTTTATTVPATTTTTTSPAAPPAIVTTNFVCGGRVCAIGPGDVGIPFAAGLIGTGGPEYGGPECNPYLMSVVAGSPPPGLVVSEPVCEWEVSGTPTKAGTYTFTVRITPQPDGFGNARGTPGTQQFSITIGAGTADRLVVTSATYFPLQQSTVVRGFDVNYGATYTVYLTSTGAELGTVTTHDPDNGGDGNFVFSYREDANLVNLTVKDSLGSTVSIPVVRDTRY